MKKKTFIKHLKEELDSLPKKEVDDIVSDYEEYFAEGKADKRKEEDIAASLGNPKKIAKQLKAEYHIKAAKKEANIQNITRAVLATAGLTLLNLIIVLGPTIAVLAVIFSFYITSASLWIASLAIIGLSIYFFGTGAILFGIVGITSAIAVFCVGILLFIGTNYLRKFVLKGIITYLKYNMKLIKGEEQ